MTIDNAWISDPTHLQVGIREESAHTPKSPSATASDAHTPPLRGTTIATSVVICTRDRPDTIKRAVESVVIQPCNNFEVLVVDQSRTNSTRIIIEQLKEQYPHLRYMHVHQAGLSRAYNVGIHNTAGAVLAFTDDDCVAPPTWLPTIERCFAQDPDLALLYGQVLLPSELSVRQGVEGTTPVLGITHRQRLNKREGFKVFGMGANFAARRSACEGIGGFDEVLGGGGPLKSSQDFDFAYRIYLAGGSIVLEPEVTVDHYGFRSNDEWPATLKAYGIGDGAFYFKHVRAGDLRATGMLLHVLALGVARECKSLLRHGPQATRWQYVLNIVVGMRQSLHFTVDRQTRLYRSR